MACNKSSGLRVLHHDRIWGTCWLISNIAMHTCILRTTLYALSRWSYVSVRVIIQSIFVEVLLQLTTTITIEYRSDMSSDESIADLFM